ncbi:SIMPL domain-containing protein [Massilia luteola]|uniref:SIMPL domain-containing protein n=1 Tax=Massilia luteola TaxID=3081751 RepID=UPI002ACC2E46|nr:SIMPL domain-containing protein [Massilia sp. Gc5]
MLKTRLRIAVLVLLLATGAARATPVPAYPFVHVTGSAFQAVVPDIGSLDFEIVATDADPAAARTVLETRVGEVRALMRQLGMEDSDAAVREVRQSVRKDDRAANGAPAYELRCDVHINVRNLANWAPLAGGLLGKPNLDGFASAFDRSDMDRINDELMTQAIQDARRRAEVMAAAFGRRVGGVMAATPDMLKNLGTAMGLERDDFRHARTAGDARAQDVDREQLLAVPALKLRQPVDVIFRLENAPRHAR